MRAHWKEEASQAGGGGGQLVAQFDEIYFTIQILTKKYFTAMYQAGKGAIGASTRDRQGFACTCSSYKLSFALEEESLSFYKIIYSNYKIS